MEGFVVDQVSKTYMDENQRPFQVLHNVAFSWSSGENIAVLGESGSGKSTLARLLIGIEKPNSGTITWNGEDITRWKSSTWREKRKHIQAVFQDASGTLNPARSVYHNVEEALRNLTHLDRRQRQVRIDELMELTYGLSSASSPGSSALRWRTAPPFSSPRPLHLSAISGAGRSHQRAGSSFYRCGVAGPGALPRGIWLCLSADYPRPADGVSHIQPGSRIEPRGIRAGSYPH